MEKEVCKNINGTYNSEICRHKDYIVNSVSVARYLCYDGGFRGRVEQDKNYPDTPKFIFFFPNSIELQAFAATYDEYKSQFKQSRN